MLLHVDGKNAKSAADDIRYRSLQIKYLQAENVYNKYLLIFVVLPKFKEIQSN